MRRMLVPVSLLVLMVIVAGCSSPTSTPGGAPGGSTGLTNADRSAINANLDRFAHAFKNMDSGALEDIFTPQITIVSSTDTEVVSRSDFVKQFEESFDDRTTIHDAALLNRHISGSGTTAIVTATWYIHSTVWGNEDKSFSEMEWRFRKSGNSWRADRLELIDGGTGSGHTSDQEQSIHAVLDRYGLAMQNQNMQVLLEDVFTFPVTVTDGTDRQTLSRAQFEATINLGFALTDYDSFVIADRSISVTGSAASVIAKRYIKYGSGELAGREETCSISLDLKEDSGWKIHEMRMDMSKCSIR